MEGFNLQFRHSARMSRDALLVQELLRAEGAPNVQDRQPTSFKAQLTEKHPSGRNVCVPATRFTALDTQHLGTVARAALALRDTKDSNNSLPSRDGSQVQAKP